MMFCGHANECRRQNSAWALNTAKSNIERHYSVVGVLEEMNATLDVMEAFMPEYYRDARALYYGNQESEPLNIV